jgi:hypothetical protein
LRPQDTTARIDELMAMAARWSTSDISPVPVPISSVRQKPGALGGLSVGLSYDPSFIAEIGA